MTDVSDARGDHLYRVRKRGKWSKPVSSKMPKSFSGDGAQTSRRRSARTGAMRGAGSKDPDNARQSQHDQIRPKDSAEPDSLDRGSLLSSNIRGADTPHEQASGRDQSGNTESQGKVRVPQTTDTIATGDGLIHSSIPSRRSSKDLILFLMLAVADVLNLQVVTPTRRPLLVAQTNRNTGKDHG